MHVEHKCTNPSCFFCIMKVPDSSTRKTRIKEYLKRIPDDLIDDQELILVISWLWKAAMTQPENQEFPSLGIFSCMARLIGKSIRDKPWISGHQNVYIPYYAAHIIGSYTMRKSHFAVIAVESGVIPPLLELLKGKISWVEQRVAVRALGHIASYEKTFQTLVAYEDVLITLSMNLASSCLEVVYRTFVGVKERRKRVRYHRYLLTRGVGGSEIEIRKAEEWASQLQCWSIHLLNCFAMKRRGLDLMCNKKFLEDLCEMWGGLVNNSSPSGVGLLRTLCYSKLGRSKVADSVYVVESLCNFSRSSADWQYMGVDCLLLLVKDSATRHKVIEIVTPYLLDLIELRNLCNRKNIGEAIIRVLTDGFKHHKSKIKNVCFHEINRVLKQDMSSKELEEKRVFARKKKQQGNHRFLVGQIEEALTKYTEALDMCPLQYKSERTVLYNNRAQCNLLLKNIDLAISDSTRALCLSNPPNSHVNSLWVRSQAYDMKGMAKESLMDCLMLMNSCIKPREDGDEYRVVRVPYCVMCMIRKQMDSTWLFKPAQLTSPQNDMTRNKIQRQKVHNKTGLRTISEEASSEQDIGGGRKKMENGRYRSH